VSAASIAQTAPQLWAQLATTGFAGSEIERIHLVYVTAARLFTGRSRACGKPFLDHLVGTASVVATTTRDPDLVGAALLHAAYTHNVFDDLGRGATRRRRRALRRLAGPGLEHLVYTYTTQRWDIERVRSLTEQAPEPGLHAFVLLRVANEIDEHLDGAMQLDPRRDDPLHDDEGVAAHAALARRYGLEDLAHLIEVVSSSAAAGPQLPPTLRARPGDTGTALPLWGRRSLRRTIRDALGRAWRRARR